VVAVALLVIEIAAMPAKIEVAVLLTLSPSTVRCSSAA